MSSRSNRKTTSKSSSSAKPRDEEEENPNDKDETPPPPPRRSSRRLSAKKEAEAVKEEPLPKKKTTKRKVIHESDQDDDPEDDKPTKQQQEEEEDDDPDGIGDADLSGSESSCDDDSEEEDDTFHPSKHGKKEPKKSNASALRMLEKIKNKAKQPPKARRRPLSRHEEEEEEDDEDSDGPVIPKKRLRKQRKDDTEEDDDEDDLVIPKRAKRTSGTDDTAVVPRKKDVIGDTKNKKKGKSEPTSSLLGNMAQPLPEETTEPQARTNRNHPGGRSRWTGGDRNPANNTNNPNNNKMNPPHPNNTHANKSSSGKQLGSVELLNLPHDIPRTGGPAPTTALSPQAQQRLQRGVNAIEKRILSHVTRLCQSYQSIIVLPDHSDLGGRYKRSNHSSASSFAATIDLTGSFLVGSSSYSSSNSSTMLESKNQVPPPGLDQYDFFDTNEQGDIVLMPRPPMFPEDFRPDQKPHALSWWGVVEPSMGAGKYAPSPQDRESRTTRSTTRPAAAVEPSHPSRSHHALAQRGTGGRSSGDRYAHDTSTTRQRSFHPSSGPARGGGGSSSRPEHARGGGGGGRR